MKEKINLYDEDETEKEIEINNYLKESGLVDSFNNTTSIIEEKSNKMYVKKFFQMEKTEILYLLNYKDRILKEGLYFSKHAITRMKERHIRKHNIIMAIKIGQIIDYRLINGNEIITLRGCNIRHQVYVILCLTTKTIITTYSNRLFGPDKKMLCSKKYKSDFKIDIPENFKQKLNFYY